MNVAQEIAKEQKEIAAINKKAADCKKLAALRKKKAQRLAALKRLQLCEAPEVDWRETYQANRHKLNNGCTPLLVLSLLALGDIETDDENCLTPCDVRNQLLALGEWGYADDYNNKGYQKVYAALKVIARLAGFEWMGRVRVGIYV